MEPRKRELWDKWLGRERLTNSEMEEAIALGVGTWSPHPPPADDPRYPRFLVLWSRCARLEASAFTDGDLRETALFEIAARLPVPSLEEQERHLRSLKLRDSR
jgi:hypothetical protein